MWQAYSCIERTPSKYIWKSPLRSCVNQIAVSILLSFLVPCAPRYQIGSGAMVSSKYYPEPNDDLDPVPPHETSLATDAEVVNEFIEDSKIGSDAHSQVLTLSKGSSTLTSLTRENFQFSDIQLSPPNRKILTIEYEESDAFPAKRRDAEVTENVTTFHRAPIQSRVETNATKIFQWKQFVKAMEEKSSHEEKKFGVELGSPS